MKIEDILAKNISNEIDVQILKNILKAAKTPKKEIYEHISTLRKKNEIDMERNLMGGSKTIHGDQ